MSPGKKKTKQKKKKNRDATIMIPKNTRDAIRKELMPRNAIHVQPILLRHTEIKQFFVYLNEWLPLVKV